VVKDDRPDAREGQAVGQHGPLLTFHQVRERARIILADALKGNNPVSDGRAAPTMKELAADYLECHAITKVPPRSVAGDRSMIERTISPRLESTAVQSRDIQGLHVTMKATPYQANRLLALLSKMFSPAVEWGWRSDNPAKGIERYHEERRERWLSDTELSALLKAPAEHPIPQAANAVRFQLLTGADW
jgi:hypothetical protein